MMRWLGLGLCLLLAQGRAAEPSPAAAWFGAGHVALRLDDAAGGFRAQWRFDRADNDRVMTLQHALQNSVNLVFVPGGARKTVGVIFPSRLTFKTGEPELMEIVAGSCRVTLPGAEPRVYHAGESFKVPANSSFDIEALETLDYVCHFG